MKTLGLINWSGHGNLGDDAMAKILVDFFSPHFKVTNLGDNIPADHERLDAYIVGGGTLIATESRFYQLMREVGLERCYGISLGVSNQWNGAGRDDLLRMRRIYVRNVYSQAILAKHEVGSYLSTDLICAIIPPVAYSGDIDKGIFANIMYSSASEHRALKETVENVLKHLGHIDDVHYFALSPIEDAATMKNVEGLRTLYTSMDALMRDLATAKTVYATRLHAVVAAWMAGVRDIRPIFYDQKICHFLEYAATMTPREAHRIVVDDLAWIKEDILKH